MFMPFYRSNVLFFKSNVLLSHFNVLIFHLNRLFISSFRSMRVLYHFSPIDSRQIICYLIVHERCGILRLCFNRSGQFRAFCFVYGTIAAGTELSCQPRILVRLDIPFAFPAYGLINDSRGFQ